MRNYELSVLLSAQAAQEDPSPFMQKMGAFLQSQGGEIKKEGVLGRRLFFQGLKSSDAILVATVVSIDSAKTTEIQAWLHNQPEIFRFLLLETSLKPRKESMRRLPPQIKPEVQEAKVEMGEIDKKLEEIFKEP